MERRFTWGDAAPVRAVTQCMGPGRRLKTEAIQTAYAVSARLIYYYNEKKHYKDSSIQYEVEKES